MAIGETAALIASLELQDKFSGTARAAEARLSGLERATSNAGTRMSGLSRLAGGAGLAMGTFRTRIGEAGRGVASLVGSPLGLLGLGAAFGKTITASRDFDVSLRRIVGLTGVTSGEIDGIRKSILSLSTDVGKGPQELADAFYFIASAGFNAKEAVDVLNTSARASAAGLGQTQDVAQVLGAAINAYGHQNLSAAHAADVLTAAVQDGSAEAVDFVNSLQFVIPTAAAVGVSLEDVTAAIAGLTLGGASAETATVNLNQVLSTLLKPSAQTKTALEGVGLSAEGLQAQLKDKGLLSTLETLRDHFGDNTAAMAKAFGNVRALRGVLGLLNLDADQLQKVFGDTANATDVLKKAFADTEGPGRKMDRAFAAIQTTLINLGDTYLPAFADALSGIGTWLATHQQDVTNFGKGALEIVRTIGSVVGGIAGGLSRVWGAIPDPLKDLLIKGFIADRTIKFLFGFSPLKLITQPITDALGKIVGQFIANKLTPQLVTAAGPLPVFVTNPGGIGGGIPTAAGKGGGFLGSFIGNALKVTVVGIAAAAVTDLAFQISGLFDPRHVNPESGRVFRGTNVQSEQEANLEKIIPILRERAESGDAFAAKQLATSIATLAELRGQSGTRPVKVTNAPEINADAIHAQREANRMQQAAFEKMTLELRLIKDKDFKPKLDAKEFISILKRTSEFGQKGVGTQIEQGPRTGRDPFGAAFLALAKRLENPKQPAVLGEINRHIAAAEGLQRDAISEGRTWAARQLQHTINGLHRLVGSVDRQKPALDRAAEHARTVANNTARYLGKADALNRITSEGVGVQRGILAKDFSPHVSVTTNVSTAVSINDVVRSLIHTSTATGTGPGGPIMPGLAP